VLFFFFSEKGFVRVTVFKEFQVQSGLQAS
jgi:hypothetical protein